MAGGHRRDTRAGIVALLLVAAAASVQHLDAMFVALKEPAAMSDPPPDLNATVQPHPVFAAAAAAVLALFSGAFDSISPPHPPPHPS